jgi:hypothetical protein
MANRNYNRKQALEKEVKEIYLDVAIGSSGAPTLTKGLGVASISRSSTGLYVITLQDAYMRLMAAQVSILSASAQDIAAQLQAESVASAKTITFRTQVAAATVADPSSGSRILIRLDLKNSSI